MESPQGEFEVVDDGKYSVFVFKDEMIDKYQQNEVKRQESKKIDKSLKTINLST